VSDQDSFYKGLWCDYKQHHGYIRFVGDTYITLCIATKPNVDPNARRMMNECCLLIFKEDWEHLIPIISKREYD